MSADLDGCRIQEVLPHGEDEYNVQSTFSHTLPRQNLTGGTGVFANFFEEMADPQSSDMTTRDLRSLQSDRGYLPIVDKASGIHCDGNASMGLDYPSPMHAYFGGHMDDEDLRILDQYRGFINRTKDSSTPTDHHYVPVSPSNHSAWDVNAAPSALQPQGAITEYFRSDLGSNMCISYTQRCKLPKILAKRFLLGETIGRGSYGKVKDSIDLITFRRHAVKIINKFGIRKIPGGWSQALSEAAVMRRLPPNRHIVSLVAVLRLDNPDRLCIIMEHCIGSVHDLQAAGVPATSTDLDNDLDECAFGPNCDGPSGPSGASNDRRVQKNSRRCAAHFPMIATDIKQETRRLTDVFKRRKVSNAEFGFRNQSSVLPSQHQQFRRLPEAQAHAYFLQLIDGLHFLHQHGIIHRDIKPANLLLTPAPGCGLSTVYSVADTMDAPDSCWYGQVGSGQPGFLGRTISELLRASRGWLVKLTDFGVSASLSAFSRSDQVSGGQTTPAVQPPEVAKGVQSVFVGPQLDVYSAGVTLYFMLTGHVPFSCQNVLQIFEAIAQGDYVIPGHVSAQAAQLVRKMMHKDPKKRITLSQIKKHPWVIHDPIPSLTLKDIYARWQTRSFDCTARPIERGYVFWLEPLEILRRPSYDYPVPHIDDTGARILSIGDFVDETSLRRATGDEQAQTTASSSTELLTGVAPLSVLSSLKVHLAMSQPTAHSGSMNLNPETTPNMWSIEDCLAHLGIDSGHDDPACGMSHQLRNTVPQSPGNVDRINQTRDPAESAAWDANRHPEFVASFTNDPIRNHHTTAQSSAKFIPGFDYYEPPPCPEDLPVAEPSCCLSTSQVAFAVAPGGYIRTASFHAYTDDDLVGESITSDSNNNQCTWHAGSRPKSGKIDISQFQLSPRAQTVDSGLAKRGLKSERHFNQSTHTTSAHSLSKLHRRLSQWWSNSVLSLRKRFHRRPRFQLDNRLSLDSTDPETPRVDSTVSPSIHESSLPSPSEGHTRRTRRWFLGRSPDSATSTVNSKCRDSSTKRR